MDLIVEDTTSKWIELYALAEATSYASSTILIEEFLFGFGVPRQAINNNGIQFVSEIMQEVCDAFKIKQYLIPLYHAEGN